MSAMPQAFDGSLQRMSAAVARALANASATWQGGLPFGVLFDRELDAGDGFVPEVVTSEVLTVSLCVANTPGIAEGSTGLKVNGRTVRVITPVVPDAGGWASFTVVEVA